jgi:hypothetical protein
MEYNIKMAGQYSKKLGEWIDEISRMFIGGYNQVPEILVNITEEHKKSTIKEGLIDETKVIKKRNYDGVSANTVLQKQASLITEKLRIDNEISKAKQREVNTSKTTFSNVDMAIQENIRLRNYAKLLNGVLSIKENEIEKEGQVSAINAEGNATRLNYPITLKVNLNFDKDEIAKAYKDNMNYADEVSRIIDDMLTNVKFGFEPEYSIYEDLESIIKR